MKQNSGGEVSRRRTLLLSEQKCRFLIRICVKVLRERAEETGRENELLLLETGLEDLESSGWLHQLYTEITRELDWICEGGAEDFTQRVSGFLEWLRETLFAEWDENDSWALKARAKCPSIAQDNSDLNTSENSFLIDLEFYTQKYVESHNKNIHLEEKNQYLETLASKRESQCSSATEELLHASVAIYSLLSLLSPSRQPSFGDNSLSEKLQELEQHIKTTLHQLRVATQERITLRTAASTEDLCTLQNAYNTLLSNYQELRVKLDRKTAKCRVLKSADPVLSQLNQQILSYSLIDAPSHNVTHNIQ